MCNHKGFTLVELMLALAVGGLLLALVLPFFWGQSTYSYNSTQSRLANQSVDLVLALLKRDILQAGFGVAAVHPELALAKTAGADANTPDTLYLSYGDHLNIQGVTSLPQGNPGNTIRQNSVFYDQRGTSSTPYQGYSDGALTLVLIPTNVSKRSIGAIIDTTGGKEVTMTTSPATPPSTGYWNSISFSGATASGTWAPAICYKVVSQALWRNAGPGNVATSLMGYPVLGKDPQMVATDAASGITDGGNMLEVRNFKVTLLDATNTPTTVVTNTKRLQVVLTYASKVKTGKMVSHSGGFAWSHPPGNPPQGFVRTMTVGPRTFSYK